MKHLVITLRDFALTALETGALAVAIGVHDGTLTRASAIAAGVLALRTFAGLVANYLEAKKTGG